MLRLLLALNILIFASVAHADIYETSDGYYYPQITSFEDFDRVLLQTPDPTKDVRIGFVNSINKASMGLSVKCDILWIYPGASDSLVLNLSWV